AFTPLHYLYINEVVASNKEGIRDEYFESNDWVEIYNPNNTSVDLSGFYLSDEVSNKKKYRIGNSSAKTIVPPNGFLLLWMDDDTEQGNLHCNFKADAQADSIYL